MNTTPRKCLDYKTPLEVFSKYLLHFKCELTFFIHNTQSEIIASCNGFMFNGDFNAIYTDQLWVHPSERNKGLAKKANERSS